MRFYFLDHVRLVAAFAVMLYHYFYKGVIGGKILSDYQPQQLLKFGYLGVDIFFVISGFVIFLSYGRHSVKRFVYLRFRSIYPSFILCVFVTLALAYLSGERFTISTVLLNLVFLPEIFGFEWVDGVYWTLFFEVFFYSITAIFLLLRFNRFGLFIILLMWLTYYCWSLYDRRLGFFASGYFLHFILGALTAFIFADKNSASNRIYVCIFYFIYIAVFLLSAHFVYLNCANLIHVSSYFDRCIAVVTYLILVFLFYFSVFFIKDRYPSTELTKSAGRSSYFIYLLHAGVGYNVMHLIGTVSFHHVVIVACSVIFVSYVLARHVEERYLKFFDRFKPQ